MKEFKRVQVEGRDELHAWLKANHSQTESIWLVNFKKHVPEKYIPWDEVVEEALCFGWIDSMPSKLDADRTMLRRSPRRPGSPWSRLNKRRVEILRGAGLMAPPGLAAIERAKQDGSWTIYDEIEDLVIPKDLAAVLAANPEANGFFKAFSESSRKAILWWIKSAKTPATRSKQVQETVRLARHNVRANHSEARAFYRKQEGKKRKE